MDFNSVNTWVFNNFGYVLLGVILSIVLGAVIALYVSKRRSRIAAQASTTTTPATATEDAPSAWNKLLADISLLGLPMELNLVGGAFVDFLLGYIAIALLMFAMHAQPPLAVQLLLAFMVGLGKYFLLSTRFLQNIVPTFQIATVTWFERIIPSGPDGKGLRPGRYWLLLGWPFYKIAITQDAREESVPFANMQVWTKNSDDKTKGAVQGVLDGLAQFSIIDPGAFNAVKNPLTVLTSLTHESARDAAEDMTAEGFLATENDQLGHNIYKIIVEKLRTRIKPLGVRCISVTVNLTDIKNAQVEQAWGQITTQRASAAADAIAAAARIRRIKGYKNVGIDANRAAPMDLIATGKTGASVKDDRINLDVGQSLKDIGQSMVDVIGRKFGGQP